MFVDGVTGGVSTSAAAGVVGAHRSVRVAPEKGVEEVARGEGLGAHHLIIAAIKVDWLFQAERVDSFQALALNFDLLGVRKVTQRHPTVIQGLTTLLLFRAELMEVRHGVRLGDFVLRQLVQI